MIGVASVEVVNKRMQIIELAKEKPHNVVEETGRKLISSEG